MGFLRRGEVTQGLTEDRWRFSSSLQQHQTNVKLTKCESSHRRRMGEASILKFDIFLLNVYQKRSFFLVSSGWNWNFATFDPPCKNIFSCVWKNPFLPTPGNNLSDAHERSMLFLSQGIVYWLQTLLHLCDKNAVFIDDVLRVYPNSLPQKIGKKQNQNIHTHCISESF